MPNRPPCDELWAAIAARLVFSDVLRDDVTGHQIRRIADDIYTSVMRAFEIRTSGQVISQPGESRDAFEKRLKP